MSEQIVEIARFWSPQEASLARDRLQEAGFKARLEGEAMGTWFWHLDSATGGIRLVVREEDAPTAREMLDQIRDEADEGSEWAEAQSLQEDREQPVAEEDPESPESPSPELLRAWRAGVIGLFVCPPLLSLYSLWILYRYNHLAVRRDPQSGENRPREWRALAALTLDLVAFVLAAVYAFAALQLQM